MKKLKLTMGKYALVDDKDFIKLNKFKWHCLKRKNAYYAGRNCKNKKLLLHREILSPKKGEFIDHINSNGLDNRKKNLRICSKQENNMNQNLSSRNKTGYKGVHKHVLVNKWYSQIRINGKGIHLGMFNNKKDAAKAYNKAAIKYFGKFANLNKIKENKNV